MQLIKTTLTIQRVEKFPIYMAIIRQYSGDKIVEKNWQKTAGLTPSEPHDTEITMKMGEFYIYITGLDGLN